MARRAPRWKSSRRPLALLRTLAKGDGAARPASNMWSIRPFHSSSDSRLTHRVGTRPARLPPLHVKFYSVATGVDPEESGAGIERQITQAITRQRAQRNSVK